MKKQPDARNQAQPIAQSAYGQAMVTPQMARFFKTPSGRDVFARRLFKALAVTRSASRFETFHFPASQTRSRSTCNIYKDRA